MKRFRKFYCVLMVLVMLFSVTSPVAEAAAPFKIRQNLSYSMSPEVTAAVQRVYNRYNFTIGWGIYDISGRNAKEVASYNAGKLFQSNCTIKAAMLLYICKRMDAGKLSLDTKFTVKRGDLHYEDFPGRSGEYTLEYLVYRMIHVSNNSCYEILLRYVGLEKFNAFLLGLGSGTKLTSYKYMGNCTVWDRAVEWNALYRYCHTSHKNSSYAWNLLLNAKYSPIRDGLGLQVAHKSGWHNKLHEEDEDIYGTAGDCAVIKTENGGCYLMIMFTRNNVKANYSQALMRELARALNKVWNEYYEGLPKARKKTAAF